MTTQNEPREWPIENYTTVRRSNEPRAIRPRYWLGDIVYLRRLNAEVVQQDCPVCNGTAYAQVVGSDKTARCPECSSGKVSVGQRHYRAEVRQLTIGRVQATITQRSSGSNMDPGTGYLPEEITYMAWETGVGSGNIWHEADLLPTRAEAEALPVPPDEDISEPLKPYNWRLPESVR